MSEIDVRQRMLANVWTTNLWPKLGDVASLSVGLPNPDHEGGNIVVGVTGQTGAEELMELLVSALLDEPKGPPEWLALTQTGYFDSAAIADLESGAVEIPHSLQEDPTPTTQHGLIVVCVDVDGVHTSMWAVDLEPKIELPEEPEFSSTEDGTELVGGVVPALLFTFFWALRIVGGEE